MSDNSSSNLTTQFCVFSFDNGVAVIVVNLIIVSFGGAGNFLVLLTIFSSKRLHRTISVYGIAALAFTDLLTNLAVQPSEVALIYYHMHKDCGGHLLWPVFKTSALYLCGTSLLILDYMSVDRCLAICCGLWYKRTITLASAKVALAVVFSSCIFPAISSLLAEKQFIVEAYLLFSGLVVCFIVIFVCYLAIIIHVCKQNTKRRSLQNTQNVQMNPTLQNNKKLAKTVALIIGLFLVCWTPLAFVLAYSIEKNPFSSESSAWPVTIGLLSSSLNPLVYFYRNKEFRVALREVLMSFRHRCPVSKRAVVHPEENTSTA